MNRLAWILVGLWGAAACQPNTTRPGFVPLPEAAGTEIRLVPREATRQVAEALRASAVPVRTIRLRDGYLETGWFDVQSGRQTRRRPLGTRTVRVRAWADPARPGSSQLTVETTYRLRVDPSLPERELDRQVSKTHPVAVKVEGILKKLVERYGGAPVSQAEPPATTADTAAAPRPRADSARAPRPKADSARVSRPR
jgi:hypothetical protein